jgi:hypothetical protein
MGARKGQNNFEKMQREKVESGKRIVEHALKYVKKGVVFTDLNALIVYVAEKTSLHRTTINRNPEYLTMVLDYFAKQPGAVGFVSDKDADVATTRARRLADATRIKNLEVENARLKKAIARTPNNHDSPSNKLPLMPDLDNESKAPTNDIAFANTAMTLLVVLERLAEKGLGIVVDIKQNQILDISEVISSRKIIAAPEKTKWFFEWLASHPSLGNLHGLDVIKR